MAKTFAAGIEIPHYKEQTEELPVRELPLPHELIIPLRQHIGAPNRRLVSVGERVKAGQILGQSDAFVSAPVHTGLSGTVREIGMRQTLTGVQEECVVIDVDPVQEPVSWPEESLEELSRETILERIKNAGVVGMGGAAFPTHVKVNPTVPIDTVILNGCECEPFLTCDHRLMLEAGEEILAGARVLSKVLGGARVIFGVEENKADAIEKLSALLEKEKGMEIVPLAVKYPQGAEKQLIYATTGRVVPTGKLPSEVGVVVQNVATAQAVADAVLKQKPLTERIVTLTGPAAAGPGNYRVHVGTPVSHIIAATGGLKEEAAKIVVGGPMTGWAQSDLSAPVVKGSGGILALTAEITLTREEYLPCVRCGKCVEHCPMFLYPNYIGIYSERGRHDLAREWGAANCFECGICAYVCPAKRPMIDFVRASKRAAT
ncbi:MAG TPA: electron transport complex subunit RsxC [Firmicutes bacterium]|nr:electron transport complex subunit RsxC [Bacillota bacterium]